MISHKFIKQNQNSYKKFNLQKIESWNKLRATKIKKKSYQKKRQTKLVYYKKILNELKKYETKHSKVKKNYVVNKKPWDLQKFKSYKYLKYIPKIISGWPNLAFSLVAHTYINTYIHTDTYN